MSRLGDIVGVCATRDFASVWKRLGKGKRDREPTEASLSKGNLLKKDFNSSNYLGGQ